MVLTLQKQAVPAETLAQVQLRSPAEAQDQAKPRLPAEILLQEAPAIQAVPVQMKARIQAVMLRQAAIPVPLISTTALKRDSQAAQDDKKRPAEQISDSVSDIRPGGVFKF